MPPKRCVQSSWIGVPEQLARAYLHLTPPLPPCYSSEARERAISVPPRLPGAAGGFLLLLRPWRRGKGGGTPDLCCRAVNRVWACVAGGGVKVRAALVRSAFWSSRIRPFLVDAGRVDDGSVGVSPGGRRGDDGASVSWESCPRALCRCAAVSSIVGAGLLRYVFGGRSAWVAPRPARVWWSKEDESVVGAPSRWCSCADLRPGEGWRCSFIVLRSGALRRATPDFKACSSSRLVVSGWCSFAFSGDGEGVAVALIRVSPRRIPVLAYVLIFVLCIF